MRLLTSSAQSARCANLKRSAGRCSRGEGVRTQRIAGLSSTTCHGRCASSDRELRQQPRLHARLDTPQGARVAALSLRPLFSRLAEEAVVGAAWPDTVSAFLDV